MRGIIALDFDIVESPHRFLSTNATGQVNPQRWSTQLAICSPWISEKARGREAVVNTNLSPTLWSARRPAGDSRGAAFFFLFRVNLLSRQLHVYTLIHAYKRTRTPILIQPSVTLSFFLRSFYHRYYYHHRITDPIVTITSYTTIPSATIYHYRYRYFYYYRYYC